MNIHRPAGLRPCAALAALVLTSVVALAAVRSQPPAYADGAGKYEAHLRLECYDRSVNEGHAYRVMVENLHGQGKGNDHMKVYWTTYAMTADGADYHHVQNRRQKSNNYQRWKGKMGRNFPTVADPYPEPDEKFQVKFRNASWDRPDGNHDGWSRYHWCTATIHDDDGVGIHALEIISAPEDGAAYRAGERIEILARFTGEVEVEPPVLLPLRLGAGPDWWRGAHYDRHQEDRAHVFSYQVQPEDRDTDGVGVEGSYQDDDGQVHGLGGGGSIKVAGTDEPINPWFRTLADDPAHRVAGSPRSQGTSR